MAKKARKSSKRSRAARKAARTRKQNHERRSRIAKKAARCRKRRRSGGKTAGVCKTPRRRSKRRRALKRTHARRKSRKHSRRRRRAHPTASYSYPPGHNEHGEERRRRRRRRKHSAAAPRRRRRRHHAHAAPRRRRRRRHHRAHSRRRRHGRRHHMRAMNPISGWGEMISAVGGVVLGAVSTVLFDRYAASHALTGTAATSLVDSPSAGQLYNATAASAPIWSNWKRLVAAGANLVVPLGASMVTKKHPKVQTFFQTYFFAALTTVLGKVTLDVLPKALGTKAIGARLLAPEIDGQNGLAAVKASSTPLAPYTLVAGGTGPGAAPVNTGGTMLGVATSALPNGGGITPIAPSGPPQQAITPGGGSTPAPTPAPSGIDPVHHSGGCESCGKDNCDGDCDDLWDQYSQGRDQAAQ